MLKCTGANSYHNPVQSGSWHHLMTLPNSVCGRSCTLAAVLSQTSPLSLGFESISVPQVGTIIVSKCGVGSLDAAPESLLSGAIKPKDAPFSVLPQDYLHPCLTCQITICELSGSLYSVFNQVWSTYLPYVDPDLLNSFFLVAMLSVKRDTVDSFCSLSESRGRRSSIHPNAVLVLPFRNESRWSNPNATALRPPPLASTASTAPPLQSKGLHLRLRSDSGLSLHTNQSAFRQYTDYNSDGSWGSRYSPTRSHSLTKSCSTDNFRLVSKPFSKSASKDIIAPPKTLPDFFDPAIIKLAFSNPATGQRLCQFARTRNSGADMEFLLKVDEYTRAFSNMKSLISQISADFTSVTATSPLDLPVDICNNMKTCAKHCAKQAMPALEKLYRDAKTNVEERLAQTLYPQYVKHQLCQCMRSSLSISRSLTGGFKSAYPGLGNAFCLSDPLEPDNPIVAASDGFLNMSGFERNEVIQKNCRFLQGMSTNPVAARRLSEAVSAGRETTELLINHRKDGTPFWNLLFICPLLENGSIRYFFGAQINVSESMGSDYKDILRILNFGLPEEGLPSKDPKTQRPQEVPASRVAPAPETESVASAQGSQGIMYRHRFFRRFSRKSPRPAVTTPNVSSAPAGEVPRAAKRRAYTARSPQQHDSSTDEFSTPYSRFFVLRYIPPIVGSHINADKRHYQPRMSVAFCSSFALSLLGLKSHEAEQIQGRDIFSVLSSGSINSASGNRASLRSAVGEKMMAGQSFSVDLVTSAEVLSHTTRAVRSQQQRQQQQHSLKHARNGSIIRSPGASSSEDEGAPRNHNQHSRLSDTLDRGAEILSHVFFGPKMKKLVSHWTPLKNGEGLVEWVVLILTPATA